MEPVLINGQEYKIGLRGHVFVNRSGTWMLALHIKSAKVILAIDAKRKAKQIKPKRYAETREKIEHRDD